MTELRTKDHLVEAAGCDIDAARKALLENGITPTGPSWRGGERRDALAFRIAAANEDDALARARELLPRCDVKLLG